MKKESGMLNYQVSRELKTALELIEEIVQQKDYKVIESQDILLSIVSTIDTGAGHALGRSSITRSKVSKEIAGGERVHTRKPFVSKIDPESFGSRGLIRDEKREYKKTKPVQLAKEKSTGELLKYAGDFPISENVKGIFDFAEEMRLQLSPDGVLDSYWLLIGSVQDEECNAFYIIEKQMLLFDRFFSGEDLVDCFPVRYNLAYEYSDGKAAKELATKQAQSKRFTSKLENPDYSILEDIATDITEQACAGELMAVVGREKEIRQMEIALTRRDKNNVALIGPGGVGKSAIVDGLALKIVNGEVPSLAGKRILQFSLNNLWSVISEDSKNGILRFIDEMKREKNIILFVDEVHMLGNVKSITDAFKPLMARGDFRLIGATTPTEWRLYIASDTALVRRFETISIDEPSVDDAIEIVKTIAPAYETFHQANYSEAALELAVRLAKKYLEGDKLPDSAFTILDNAGALVRIESNHSVEMVSKYQEKLDRLREELKLAQAIAFNEDEVERLRNQMDVLEQSFQKDRNQLSSDNYTLKILPEDIKRAVEQKSGKTVQEYDLYVGDKGMSLENARLLHLKENLNKKVIGQSHAISAVADAVIRSKKGFSNPKKPIGVFLFLGTTGVGKTETAKVLAEELFGSKNDMIRFDMSEYQQEHEVAKLIGSPPGFVGFGMGGQLTNAVQKNPTSVILFDEIEKAHPKIFDILLQVFDDGRLTDSMGMTVDFTKTIIILTSNLGTNAVRKDKAVGFNRVQNPELDAEIIRQKTLEACQEFFRPELLNRIDEVVTFEPFDQEEVLQITRLLVEEEIDHIKEQGYQIRFTEEAIRYLAKVCYDPENGARPIRRGIMRLIQTPLAEKIISGELQKNSQMEVSVSENQLHFEVIG
ncbi:ATP-dependent Clp protease [Streptococcus varani]|uniref:ATP-dependent Clp protease n=1 Tax=Streptococcus varani TaxID=1608583 RepID=A0A0E4CTQ1_9STRE|nr:ATP-dependent Clp protease ATP-binding subunit [Streptococcus varani]CQR26012.1 ATP-dependent Clp protease [Streptococcus varani]